jgi:hypothetical protein
MLIVKTPSGFMLKIPAWMTRPEAESMTLACEITLPCSALLTMARLLADVSVTTVAALSQPENRDASERVRVPHKATDGRSSCQTEPRGPYYPDGTNYQHGRPAAKRRK